MISAAILMPTEVVSTTTSIVVAAPEPLTNEEKIVQEATLVGIDPQLALAIAWCESKYIETTKNPHSTASGIFQFIRGTWQQTVRQMQLPPESNVFDADTNIKAGVWLLKKEGTKPWNASKHCWYPRLSRQ